MYDSITNYPVQDMMLERIFNIVGFGILWAILIIPVLVGIAVEILNKRRKR